MELSPPAKNGAPYTTTLGKFPKLEIERITSARTLAAIKDKTVPPRAVEASEFVQKFFGNDYKHIGHGIQGSVYVLNGKDEATLQKLKELFSSMTNLIVGKNPSNIKTRRQIVLKVSAVPKAKRMFWSTDNVRRQWVEAAAKYDVSLLRNTKKNTPGSYKKAVATREALYDAWTPRTRHREVVERYMNNNRRNAWIELLFDAARDASNHQYLMEAAPFTVPCEGGGTVTLDAREVVPEFYFAGSHPEYGVYVSVMTFIGGSVSKVTAYTPAMMADLEKAAMTLAVCGMEHGDLHESNVMVTRQTYRSPPRIKIIDFGLSVVLPQKYKTIARQKVEELLKTYYSSGVWSEKNLNNIYYHPNDGTMRYLDVYMPAVYGIDWFNPTGKLLRYVKSVANFNGMAVARKKLWSASCKKPGSPSTSKNQKKRSPRQRSPVRDSTGLQSPIPTHRRIVVERGVKKPVYNLNYGNL